MRQSICFKSVHTADTNTRTGMNRSWVEFNFECRTKMEGDTLCSTKYPTRVLSNCWISSSLNLKSTQPNDRSLHLFRLNCTINLTKSMRPTSDTQKSLANLSLPWESLRKWRAPKLWKSHRWFRAMAKGLRDNDAPQDEVHPPRHTHTYSMKSKTTRTTLEGFRNIHTFNRTATRQIALKPTGACVPEDVAEGMRAAAIAIVATLSNPISTICEQCSASSTI